MTQGPIAVDANPLDSDWVERIGLDHVEDDHLAGMPGPLHHQAQSLDHVHHVSFSTESHASDESTNDDNAEAVLRHAAVLHQRDRDFAFMLTLPVVLTSIVFGIAVGMLARDI